MISCINKEMVCIKITTKYTEDKFTIPTIILLEYLLNYNKAEIDNISSTSISNYYLFNTNDNSIIKLHNNRTELS